MKFEWSDTVFVTTHDTAYVQTFFTAWCFKIRALRSNCQLLLKLTLNELKRWYPILVIGVHEIDSLKYIWSWIIPS